MTGYCFYPKRCTSATSCPNCMAPEIERLHERIKALEAELKAAKCTYPLCISREDGTCANWLTDDCPGPYKLGKEEDNE